MAESNALNLIRMQPRHFSVHALYIYMHKLIGSFTYLQKYNQQNYTEEWNHWLVTTWFQWDNKLMATLQQGVRFLWQYSEQYIADCTSTTNWPDLKLHHQRLQCQWLHYSLHLQVEPAWRLHSSWLVGRQLSTATFTRSCNQLHNTCTTPSTVMITWQT